MAPILPMTSSFMCSILLIVLSSDRWNFLVVGYIGHGPSRKPHSSARIAFKQALSFFGNLESDIGGGTLMKYRHNLSSANHSRLPHDTSKSGFQYLPGEMLRDSTAQPRDISKYTSSGPKGGWIRTISLGAVAVYFFLTVLWNKVYFPGPYKALEKGIAFLYFFVAGESMESMSVFMPRSSFYEIVRTFFKEERSLFNKDGKVLLNHVFHPGDTHAIGKMEQPKDVQACNTAAGWP
ncbi:hypothetical protein K457DRAFT_25181 [Linnemannia elongata AG-77]|uniref:Uncharacterized protein n=1 Tax=Linnemannia elongata AG-77 TaxID=1314771 RepID=A0A197JFT8_9FUNG|nr:hypothetical protein K457DRAFT_25181 [Linnemannia elongata AG-77]